MFRLRQTFDARRVTDIFEEVSRQLATLKLNERIGAGQTVAITAGSRGIAHIGQITRAVVEHVKGLGATPYIVPAMGSHGGGTAAGQTQLLEHYGITPEQMGCEIRASMETVIVDTTPQGIPVHFDKHASKADHVLIVGRVKPHTGFVGDVESGLHKMMLIGLGKHEGAKIYHRAIADYSFMEIITAVAASVIAKCRVVGGLAIVENAYDETALIEALTNGTIKSAALDVFWNEPNINPVFFSMPNVVLHPHHGSGTVETRKAMGQLVRQNLGAHFSGQPVLTPVL